MRKPPFLYSRGDVKMNPSRNAVTLEQYRCRCCGRQFHINKGDRSSFDLDFGCPYGCDDNGEHHGDTQVQIRPAKEP